MNRFLHKGAKVSEAPFATVSEDYLVDKDRKASRNQKILLVVWLITLLIPTTLFFAPWLGLHADPYAFGGHARAIQVIAGIAITIYMSLIFFLGYLREARGRATIKEIRARGPVGYQDASGKFHEYPPEGGIWEAGITEITYPYAPRWTGKFVTAKNRDDAETQFENQGFYRNLVVRFISKAQA